jgi:16S rRNA (cytidine1402-2'-O)-methyltransferase
MENTSKGKLFLIPTVLGDAVEINTISPQIREVINTIDEYIVENERSARRYLKQLGIVKPIHELVFHLLNEHTNKQEITSYLNNIEL